MGKTKKPLDKVDLDKVNVDKEWLYVGETARILYIHPNTLRRWGDKGLIKMYRMGLANGGLGRRRFKMDDIAQFILDSVK